VIRQKECLRPSEKAFKPAYYRLSILFPHGENRVRTKDNTTTKFFFGGELLMFRMWFSMHFSVFLIQKKGINDKFDLKE
jgi:hypothetical protein